MHLQEPPPGQKQPVEFDQAINYVNKIKVMASVWFLPRELLALLATPALIGPMYMSAIHSGCLCALALPVWLRASVQPKTQLHGRGDCAVMTASTWVSCVYRQCQQRLVGMHLRAGYVRQVCLLLQLCNPGLAISTAAVVVAYLFCVYRAALPMTSVSTRPSWRSSTCTARA